MYLDALKKMLDKMSSMAYVGPVRSDRLTARDVKALREQLGMTQVEFSILLGVASMTISRWERGTNRVPLAMSTHIRDRVGKSEKSQ